MFTEKHLGWSLYLIKRLQRKCFPLDIAKFLRTPILKNIWAYFEEYLGMAGSRNIKQ